MGSPGLTGGLLLVWIQVVPTYAISLQALRRKAATEVVVISQTNPSLVVFAAQYRT